MEFVLGGTAACMAGFFTNPMDVIKTRQQLQGELERVKGSQPYGSFWQSVKSIVESEGVLGLQKGLPSALAFQFVMNSTRLGLYQIIDDLGYTRDPETNSMSLWRCIISGGVSGTAGSALGCPFFLVKVQMQAKSHGKYAVGYQHSHHGTLDAFKSIFRTQGIFGLWRGCSGIILRTMVGSSAQLSTFSMSKDFVQQFPAFSQSVVLTSVVSAMTSGLFCCICMNPFDVISTRMFNQGVDKSGKGLLYRNVFDCCWKTFKAEGVKGLYKGFNANYLRLCPHTVLNLTFWEKLKQLHKQNFNDGR